MIFVIPKELNDKVFNNIKKTFKNINIQLKDFEINEKCLIIFVDKINIKDIFKNRIQSPFTIIFITFINFNNFKH